MERIDTPREEDEPPKEDRNRKGGGNDDERIAEPREEPQPDENQMQGDSSTSETESLNKPIFLHADGTEYDDVDMCQVCGEGVVTRSRLCNHL